MAYTYQFGSVTEAQTPWLDTNFDEAGLLGTIPCGTASGTNTLTLTPLTAPASVGTPPFALQTQVRVSAIAANTNTGAVTAAVGGTAALSVYKDTSSGPTALSGGEIVAANLFVLTYDAALNAGAGGYHLGTGAASGSGTVTAVGTGAGLTGGPITSSGTISFESVSNLRVWANVSGGSAVPSANTLTNIIDNCIGDTQGDILYRGSSVWNVLAPATNPGSDLLSQGSGTNPAWCGGVVRSINAAGSNQSGATQLSGEYNEVTVVGSGTGVILGTIIGQRQTIWNRGANTLLVYPPSGAQIDGAGTNTAVSITTTNGGTYVMVGSTQAYTISTVTG